MDGGDVELREAQSSGYVHRGDHRLVSAARVRADGDGSAVGARLLEERGPQGVRARVDERTLVDAVAALRGDGDHQGLVRSARLGNRARLRQLYLDPPLLVEG